MSQEQYFPVVPASTAVSAAAASLLFALIQQLFFRQEGKWLAGSSAQRPPGYLWGCRPGRAPTAARVAEGVLPWAEVQPRISAA